MSRAIEPTWENIAIGDTVKIELICDEQTVEFTAAEPWERDTYQGEFDNWRVVSITRPEPKIVLPTERGAYLDNVGDVWEVRHEGGPLTFRGDGDDDTPDFAPFTRLEPVSVTAKKVLNAVRAWCSDDLDEDDGDLLAALARIGKEFKVES